MKTGVVIDSACDLPQSYIEAHNIHILPISLRFGYDVFTDTRDPQATQALYRQHIAVKDIDAETEAFTVEEIKELFLNELMLKYDRVLVITISRTRSPIFDYVSQASHTILHGYREKRRQAGLSGSFLIHTLDSKTLFTGEAVLVHEAVRLLEEEHVPVGHVLKTVEELSHHVHVYLVPQDLFYIRNRASKKGEKSVGFLSYHLGGILDIKPIIRAYQGNTQPIAKDRGFDKTLTKLFKLATEAIERGLKTPVVAMSYAGDPEIIRHKWAFKKFEKFAKNRGITIFMSVMSTTAGVHIGPGAFALAYIAD